MASIFREKNLERVSNPDTLDDYIRIANPGVWMVLVVIILLLVAAIVWGSLGTVNVDSPGFVVVERGATTLWVDESTAREIAPGSTLRAADVEGMVTGAAGVPEPVEDVVAEVAPSGQLEFESEGQWLCPLSASVQLPAGVYPATVTVDSYSPLELIFGGGQTASTSGGQAR